MITHEVARYGKYFRGVWRLNGKVVFVSVEKRCTPVRAFRDSLLMTNQE